MARKTLLVAFSYVLLTLLVPAAQRGGSRPLDLPSGGRGTDEDEEDPNETIRFFGESYEGDGFFFLLDRSGSMSGMKLEILKLEMTSALSELSEQSEFGIVAFSGDTTAFSPMPVKASDRNSSLGKAWVLALAPYGSTMMLAGAEAILEIAYTSSKDDRSIIVVGDGSPNSPGPAETLEGVIAANVEGLPFHTILIGASSEAADFMMALSSVTGGTFRHPTF